MGLSSHKLKAQGIHLAVRDRCGVDSFSRVPTLHPGLFPEAAPWNYTGEACSLVSTELLDSKDHILLILVQPLFNTVPACILKIPK